MGEQLVKVLQVNSVCGTGSTGRISTDIHNMLVEQGHESYIAYGRETANNCNSAYRIGNITDNYFHVALTRLYDKHGFGSNKATKGFISWIKELDPDVIHLHNIHGYYINIELLFNYLKKAEKPVVWTLHDCWSFTGHCSHFDFAGCDRWKTGCFNCPEKNSYPSSLLVDNSKWNYNMKKELFTGLNKMKIVTPSNWLAGLVADSFLGVYPVKVINNGIDLDLFKPTRSNFRDRYQLRGKYIILGVASVWGDRKGFQYFIELSKVIKKDDVIVMVGLTEKQRRELPKNIIGITKTNSIKELAEIYSEADVFINPTLEDNFPTTNIEALACGTPVITFNTGGSVESLKLPFGYVVDKGDIVQLTEKINVMKNIDKTKILEMSREHTVKLFNKKEKFKEYIDVYHYLG
jgi:putative colanic acid biosynthesis glycosyltransferase